MSALILASQLSEAGQLNFTIYRIVFQEQMKDKYDIEVAKKNLEFQKLNNEIDQLKAKKVKPVTSKTKID